MLFFKENITFLLLNQNVHTHITINSLSKQCYLLLFIQNVIKFSLLARISATFSFAHVAQWEKLLFTPKPNSVSSLQLMYVLPESKKTSRSLRFHTIV